MSEKLLVPDIGEFEKVEIIELLVKQGDQINSNDPVVTIESDKSSVEIPSTISGKIESVNVKVGDKVSKGDLLLIGVWIFFMRQMQGGGGGGRGAMSFGKSKAKLQTEDQVKVKVVPLFVLVVEWE